MGLLEDWWDVQQLERMWKMGEPQVQESNYHDGNRTFAEMRQRIVALEQVLRELVGIHKCVWAGHETLKAMTEAWKKAEEVLK